jgi:hypothetical protein
MELFTKVATYLRSASRLRIEERIFVEIAQSAATKNASHKKLALRLTL